MELVLQYFAGCPNWQQLEQLVLEAIAGRNDVELRCQVINTAAEAVEHEFRGSPTLLIDGCDPFATKGAPIGFYCRRYATPTGLAGSPTGQQLRKVLDLG